MHFSEWDTDNGDAEDKAIEYMCEANPDATDKEPQYIHKGAQTSWLRLHPFNLGAEWPQSKYAKFEALQTERDAYDGEHQDKSCKEVLEGDVNASEDEPDDVS